jgi:hypothetical protein
MSAITDPKQLDTYSTPEQIAEVVYEAATDGKDQLRYVAGSDARATYAMRLQLGDEAFRKAMAQQFFGLGTQAVAPKALERPSGLEAAGHSVRQVPSRTPDSAVERAPQRREAGRHTVVPGDDLVTPLLHFSSMTCGEIWHASATVAGCDCAAMMSV